MDYSFEKALSAWERIPVDNFDYMTAKELLLLDSEQLLELWDMATSVRYDSNSWRNKDNKLVKFMNLEYVEEKTVMDFGCGIGLDTIQFAAHRSYVVPADLHPATLYIVQQILALTLNVHPKKLVIVGKCWPFFICPGIDLFWSFGVLHHTPHARDILKSACIQLNPGGECRIVLHSDKRWETAMNESVPTCPTWEHPRFDEYVRKCDTVGHFTEWYNIEKVEELVSGFATVEDCQYMSDDLFVGAVIKPKEKMVPVT
jgi:SAM-dependent methyltransferase